MDINWLKKIWKNLIFSGINFSAKELAYRVDNKYSELTKIVTLNILSVLSIISSTLLAFSALLTDDIIPFFIMIGISLLFIGNIVLIRITKSPRLSVIFIHIVYTIALSAFAITDNTAITYLAGVLVYIYISFTLLKSWQATLWHLLLGIILAIVFIFKGFEMKVLTPIEIGVELSTLYILILFVNFYQKKIEEEEEHALTVSRQELIASFQQMSDEIKNRQNLEKQLKESFAQQIDNNKKLERTQKAMLNVLEDLEYERDIIARKKANDESIINSVGDGLVVVNKKRRITLANETFEKMLGFSNAELIGKDFFEVIKTFDREGNRLDAKESLMMRALESGEKSINMERYFQTKSGTLLPVSINASPVMLEGKIIGVVEAIRDITKEKEVDKAKTEFVSLASHQLKTPLSAINWYSEILLTESGDNLTPEQKDYLKEIQIGGKRMSELVNALLNVSRIDLGTFVVDPELTDLAELSEAVLKDLKKQIKEKEIVIKKSYQENMPKIMLDPKLLTIILQNLISNAVKYTPAKGHIHIEISTDQDTVDIKVADSGYGIPLADQEKIFTKLFRAANVADKVTDGTGLGLYMVKSILDKTGGSIRFESEENKGTKFFVELPLSGMKRKEGEKSLT